MVTHEEATPEADAAIAPPQPAPDAGQEPDTELSSSCSSAGGGTGVLAALFVLALVGWLPRRRESRYQPRGAARNVVWLSALLSGLLASPSLAEPGHGTVDSPLQVDAMPYLLRSDTTAGSAVIASYSCLPSLSQAGPELLFRFTLPEDARVSAWVEEDADVDVDVHLLDDLEIDGAGHASGCVARGDVIAEAEMQAGVHWLSVDTFEGPGNAGGFVLHLYAIGESGFSMPIAEGVVWQAWRRSNLDGGAQVIHQVLADPRVAGVSMKPALPASAKSVGDTVREQALVPVAAINASFFGFDNGYQAYNLAIADGVALSQNSFNGELHGTVGITSEGTPMFQMLGPGQEWPEVQNAQGGLPALVREHAGTTTVDWNAEGLSSGSFFAANPRSVFGYDAEGKLFMGTFDGRRPNARGMSFAALGEYLVSEWNADYAINLDGGGSTTMWIDGVTPHGVVNYPSDGNAEGEGAGHDGSRAVFGVLMVYGAPYNFPPRFQTQPGLDASVDNLYVYDADAIDLNPDDTIHYSLVMAPTGATIDSMSGVVSLQPNAASAPLEDIVIRAEDGDGAYSDQSFTLAIAGALGPPEVADAGVSDEAPEAPAGCGCTSASPATGWGLALLIVLLCGDRRRWSCR